jgi:arylsulfatase A-like enzyme
MTMRYRANCTWIDDMFGRSLRALEGRGLLDNAIVIYVSDHGEMLGERFYRFNKYCLYESSARVPMILYGSALPAHLRGARDHRAAELVDVYPTLLDAAGIAVPAGAAGLSLLGGRTRKAGFCALHERKDEAAFMARTPDHKLILRMRRKADAAAYAEGDILGCEFYDLRADPQEWNDLGGDPAAYADVKAGLTRHIFSRLAELSRITADV